MDRQQKAEAYSMVACAVRKVLDECDFSEMDIQLRWSNGDLILTAAQYHNKKFSDDLYVVRVAEGDCGIEGFWIERETISSLSFNSKIGGRDE